MVLSQLIRFTLPSSASTSAPAFLKLREFMNTCSGVREQYFGYSIPPMNYTKDEMHWIIHWNDKSDLLSNGEWRKQLKELIHGGARSLLFELTEAELVDWRTGLESPICEFATVRLSDVAPLSDAELQKSMHKTFTDCYFAEGFTRGWWKYALNSNNLEQPLSDVTEEQEVGVEERRLGMYCLGWETIEHHQAYARTALFDEEIDKLKPWFGPGSKGWYVNFAKHT
ncbi:hypothetical protein BGZ60DRAFT_527941 [Tricladium varicosporioides]|nr:hypothetical protein BGZ60DRAFT_527941 [Hymenoscyphus varicosporioides]